MSRITKIKNNSCHTLKIIGTPIGNSMDLSPRGIEAFEQADFILCEDTRVTKKLSQLRNFKIQKLISFNEFNESRKINSVISKIISGKNVVLSNSVHHRFKQRQCNADSDDEAKQHHEKQNFAYLFDACCRLVFINCCSDAERPPDDPGRQPHDKQPNY